MQPSVMAVIGGVLIAGGILTIIRSRRSAARRGRAESCFAYAWASAAVWFGALPVLDAISDVTQVPARSRDALLHPVLLVGLTTTLWFVVAGVRARRGEFRELQRQRIAEGRTPPRYFWTPWAIFGWTLGLGAVLAIGGGVAVGSAIGVLLDAPTAAEVDRIAQTIANTAAACTFALLPIAAAAGLWRWWVMRAEARVQLRETADHLA